MRAWSRGIAALALIATSLTGFAVAEVATAPEAEALQATGGAARFKAIEWISWGSVAGEQISNSGKTVTETSTIAGQTLAVTCSVKNIGRTRGTGSGSLLEAYRPGTWRGDGFDELYNRGGTGTANQMIVGLSNRTTANTVEFDFACSATLGGAPFPLSGLVMADAESSGGDTEHVAATIPRTNPANSLPTTWRILDRIRGGACTLTATARRTETGTAAAGTNRLEMYGPATNSCENNAAEYPGPSAIAFMENATSATKVTVAGGGKSAIALGVALDFDFGDAPLSYGEAVAGTQFNYVGGEVPLTTVPFSTTQRGTNLQTLALAELSAPSPRLGENTDGELSQPYGAAADGDDAAPVAGPDDEDAITALGTRLVTPGQTFTVDVACRRNAAVGGQVAGWIDWNLNGSFDAAERSAVVACPGAGSVQLSWTIPNDVLSSGGTKATYLRLRIAADNETPGARPTSTPPG
ncbi:CshA/CshB family fibrillar adhesin-related protein [Nocardioides sp. Bht2]|uniref:CshA/CshB family fibrillar adhesin-related protein n=1 Tax=Nocardioides sp. Bht2 TaxID=3392297 RepID=UPI0039B42AC8